MAKIREELSLVDKFSKVFSKYVDLAEKASKKMQAAQKALKSFESAAKSAGSGFSGLTGSIKNLAGAYLSLQGLKSVLNLSDTISQTTARVTMMNDGLQTTQELMNMIYGSAQRSRSSYLGMADMVGKLGTLAGDAFNSSQELVAFAEQLNKQIALSGASAASADAAILQLTQGLSSGALRGEELNSVLEQTPMVAQTIAKYLGVTIGEMRELASEGALTADVVKNALLSATDETNKAFEQLPQTWAQLFTEFQNYAIKAFQPVINKINELKENESFQKFVDGAKAAISSLAQATSQALDTIVSVGAFLYENWSWVSPIIQAAATAVIAYKTATTIATIAQTAFNASVNAFPLMWILTGIGLLIQGINWVVQQIGGWEIAWMHLTNYWITSWQMIQWWFSVAVVNIQNGYNQLLVGAMTVKTGIVNYAIAAKAGFLVAMEEMVNGAIRLLNKFIDALNTLPQVSIEAIQEVSFGAAAKAEAAVKVQANNAALEELKNTTSQENQNRIDELGDKFSQIMSDYQGRLDEIEQRKQELAESSKAPDFWDWDFQIPEIPGINSYSSEGLGGIGNSIGGSLGEDVADIKKAVDMSEEDLKMLVDMAERQYINNINLTAQTPVIQVSGQNTGNTKEDRKALANALRDILLEQSASASIRSTARVY